MITLKEFIKEVQKLSSDDKLSIYGGIKLEINCALIGSTLYVVDHEVSNPIKIQICIL